MNHQAFSKIWIIVFLIVAIGGGILAWKYFEMPKKEIAAPEEKVAEEADKPKIAYLQDGDIWIIDVNQRTNQKILDLSGNIQSFDVSKDGKKIVYTIEKDNLSEIWMYDIVSDLRTKLLSEPNTTYKGVRFSPDKNKIAYLKKTYNVIEKLFLQQGIWITDLTNGNSFRVVDSGYSIEEARSVFDPSDPCSLHPNEDLIIFDKWSPDGKYIVYRKVALYECVSGYPFINIISLDGKEDFFSEEFLNKNKFIAFGKTYNWLSTNIIWPIDTSENPLYLLEQSGPTPLINERVIVVENENIKSIITETNYESPEEKREEQHVRSNFDFNGTHVVWDEWINFFGSRYKEPHIPANIWIADLASNKKQLTNEETFDNLRPIFLKDRRIIFERSTDNKGDVYLINQDGSGEQKIVEGIEIENRIIYYESTDRSTD